MFRLVEVINGLGTGGAERSLFELLLFLQRAGIEPTVICLEPVSEGVQEAAVRHGFDVRFVNADPWIARVSKITAIVRESRPQLVHTTIFEADVAGRVAAAQVRVPVLTSLVNTSYDPIRLRDPAIKRWKLASAKAIEGWTARHMTNHFHAITHAVKVAAIRDLRIAPDRITVIERGRDPERLGEPSMRRRSDARRLLGLHPEAPVLVTVGRQEFQKGQWYLLEAMPRVLAAFPDARLLVAGRTGNASGQLEEAMRRASLNGEVAFLGHREDVPEILAAADLFVFPSLYEGLGGALIEAMALGLPIVASELPAIREVVEADRNAMLVPPGSSSDLAGAIDLLLADEARRSSMGSRSRRIFEERFTLERSAGRMIELFERVAAEGRRPGR